MKKRISLIFMTAIIFMSSLVIPANAMNAGTEGDQTLDEHPALC